MKNLELLELVHTSAYDLFTEAGFFSQTIDSIYFIKNQTLQKFNFTVNTCIEVCPRPFENVITVKVLTIDGKICVATKKQLCIIALNESEEIKTIDFQDEIAEISWNPTEELVVTVSESGKICAFSVDYLNGVFVGQGSSSVNAEVPATVYVGWGSKDTQFRGSEGKLRRHVESSVEEKPVENRIPRISWRGNGEMFVVNYWTEHKRKFVIFQTPCKALYRSEECQGLQFTVAWRPVGNMIATFTEVLGEQNVIIFEKNGQKRFTIELEDFHQEKIINIKWSPCAKILTLCTESPAFQSLHLFTSSNYKWFEKQRLVFLPHNRLLDFHWLESSQFTYKLRVVTCHDVVDYTFRSVVHNNFWAMCPVISGKTLHLTDFKEAIIPPILFSKKIINNNSINCVNFLNDTFVAIVDCANLLKIFDVSKLESALIVVDLKVAISEIAQFPLSCHHLVSKGDHDIYFVVELIDGAKVFYNYNIKTNNLQVVGTTDGNVRHLLIIPEDLGSDENALHIGKDLYLSTDKSLIRQSVAIVGGQLYNFCLSLNCCFSINGDKIAENVNSFQVFNGYLLYTTKLNELHCIKFTQDDQIYRRNIEQGATIVAAIPNSPKIVLQIPRGNLETISCRLMSIDILDRLLSEGEWKKALRFLRLEKLNANLLFDLNPDRFLTNIFSFIEAAETVNQLDALCLDFQEENVLTTLYQKKECECPSKKLSTIFDAIFKYFEQVDYAPYITTLVTINLRFFTTKDALLYIQDLLKRSLEEPDLRKKVFEAINTLKNYGCDQDILYSECLLLYDLELARFVAGSCQMDPRVYEAHLNQLKNLEEVRRRYEINLFAKRPKIAIAYLLRCSELTSDEILKFIKTHQVSREAYESCPSDSKHYKVVSRMFAEDLSKNKRHQEAGVVLKRAEMLEEALEEFTLTFRWREAVDVMNELKMGEVEKRRRLDEMAKKLSFGHAEDAAILYEFYMNNYEMAVKVLINSGKLQDAVHIVRKHARKDIIVSDILPALLETKKSKEQYLVFLEKSYIRHKARLNVVREARIAKFSYDFSHSQDYDKADALLSDTDSVTTRSTRSSRSRSSTASSRNRRKEEKKKRDLREGGKYEDIALIRELHSLIKNIYHQGDEIRSFCLLLMQENALRFKEIKNFYQLYKKIYNYVKGSLTEIWPPHFHVNNQTQNLRELADLENFEHLDPDLRTPPLENSGFDQLDLNLFAD